MIKKVKNIIFFLSFCFSFLLSQEPTVSWLNRPFSFSLNIQIIDRTGRKKKTHTFLSVIICMLKLNKRVSLFVNCWSGTGLKVLFWSSRYWITVACVAPYKSVDVWTPTNEIMLSSLDFNLFHGLGWAFVSFVNHCTTGNDPFNCDDEHAQRQTAPHQVEQALNTSFMIKFKKKKKSDNE